MPPQTEDATPSLCTAGATFQKFYTPEGQNLAAPHVYLDPGFTGLLGPLGSLSSSGDRKFQVDSAERPLGVRVNLECDSGRSCAHRPEHVDPG